MKARFRFLVPKRNLLLSPQVTLSASLLVTGTFNLLSLLCIYWIVLTRIGTGPETDAFFVALVLPQLVIAIVQSAITHVLIPVLAVGTSAERARDGWTFFQAAGLIFGLIALLLWFSSPSWVQWLAPGFPEEHRQITVSLVQVTLIAMFFTALRGVCVAIYHTKSRFLYVEVSETVAGALGIIFLLAFIGENGVFAAAWAVTLRYGAALCFVLPGMGPYQRPVFDQESIRITWSRAWPLLAGSSYTKLDVVVDRILASFAAPGLLSLLNVGQQLFGMGNLLIHKASSAPVFPGLSQLAAAGDWDEFRRLYQSRLAANAAISFGVILVLIAVGEPILSWVLSHGRFDPASIRNLWLIMVTMFGLLMGGATGQIAAMAFYAMGDTRSPTAIGVVGFTIGIVMKVAGFFTMGILGIAAATSAYYLLNVIALEVALSRKIRRASTERSSPTS